MGLITRENTEPILAGEIASGTEIENEFSKIFTLIGLSSGSEGNIEDENIASDAAIAGTKTLNTSFTAAKLKDGDIKGTKINNDILTTTEFTDASVMQAYVDTDGTSTVVTSSSTWVDIPNIDAWTVTPGSTNNYIRLEFSGAMSPVTTSDIIFDFGFLVDSVSSGIVAQWRMVAGRSPFLFHCSWSQQAPKATSIVAKPQYKVASGSGTGTWFLTEPPKVFRGLIIPAK